jgi:leader peptidase (prepilin peptidase) / N-methyltransferase
VSIITIVGCAVFGLVVGGFLPALIERLSGRQPPLRRSRLRLVELTTAATFAVVAARLGPTPALPAFLYLAGVGVALTFIDLEVKRLPNPLTLPSYPAGAALLGLAALAQQAGGAYLRALLGMAALYAFYFALALVNPGGMGFGDVKLGGVLGLYLGWLGWDALVSGTFFAFVLGALAGVALMLARRATRKSALPFGPFMLLGALGGVLWGQVVVGAYLGAL